MLDESSVDVTGDRLRYWLGEAKNRELTVGDARIGR